MINDQIEKKGNSASLLLMIIITGISQVLTLMKSSLVAGLFGTGVEIDAYNFANSIVSFIFGFIAAGISTIIIPNYVKKQNNKNVDSFITALYGLIAIIICVLIVFRYHIIGLFSNKGELFTNICCNSLIVLLLANYLLAISDVTVAYFQSKEKYILPKVINLIAQLIVICILIFVDSISISQYTFIIAGGLVINFVFDTIFAIKEGWRVKPSFDFFSTETKGLFKLFLPIVFSTGVYKLSLMIDSSIAATLNTGEITILSYASQIANMVNTVIVGTLLTYCYPKIVKKIDTKDCQKYFWDQTILFHLIVCLIICGFSTVGHPAVALLFQHGAFTQHATNYVYIGTLIYIIGQQTSVVRDMIYRFFYAKGNTGIAAKNSVIVSVVNIFVSVLLVYFIGFFGIFLGTIIASFVSLMFMFIKFKKSFGYEGNFLKIIVSFLKNIVITLSTILIVEFVKHIFILYSMILQIFVYGLLTVLVFSGLSLVFYKNIKEIIKEI